MLPILLCLTVVFKFLINFSKAGFLYRRNKIVIPNISFVHSHFTGDTDEQSKINATKEGDAMKLPKQGELTIITLATTNLSPCL